MSEFRPIRERLDALESQVAFQDELLARLNEVIARQDGEVIELRRQLRDVSARLGEVGDAVQHATIAADAAEETPPHY